MKTVIFHLKWLILLWLQQCILEVEVSISQDLNKPLIASFHTEKTVDFAKVAGCVGQ
ncbi:hypothetical protein [Methylicorpusculum sp.]|uniref:hypothetical protein n=1 Tax=Methylicorpusculum sp. TaxID=2713644 RepID=UPI00272CA149|nr:hypothetical protein [Methylicorpusculum sp.]